MIRNGEENGKKLVKVFLIESTQRIICFLFRSSRFVDFDFEVSRSIMSPSGTEVPPDQVILATGGYDHSIRFWSAFNGQCTKTAQHPDSVS